MLPWCTAIYGPLASGITLGALDLMSAAHAIAAKSILVTHDQAFRLVSGGILGVED
jgi:tRNA(fMet)-specific endonuclease VapC